ncbi:MAG: DUF460 domain-containing protein [Candidatus Aenigmatarchaeota archaeon]
MKPIIVGVDIGTTTGLAIYDLDRNLMHAGSKRNISIESLVREISFFGKPVVIATDKRKVPQPVAKIAASFNCMAFNPDHDLTTEEKDSIIKIPIKDVHEKDALSAATFAFKHFAPQFNNIDRNLESMGLAKLRDRVKEMILTKEARNISEAVEKLKPKEEKKEEAKAEKIGKEEYINWRDRAKELDRNLREQSRSYEILKNFSDKMEEKVRTLEKQTQEYLEDEIKKNDDARKKVIREKELKKMEILVKQMQFELSKQKNLNSTFQEQFKVQEELESIQSQNMLPVISIPEFTREAILSINRRFYLKNKVVWIKSFSPSNTSTNVLSSLEPKIVMGDLDQETRDRLQKKGIIVVDSVTPKEMNYYASVSPDDIESEVKSVEKKNFMDWLSDYRKRAA